MKNTDKPSSNSTNTVAESKAKQAILQTQQDASTPQQMTDLRVNKILCLSPRQNRITNATQHMNKGVVLPTIYNPTVYERNVVQIDEPKCALDTNKYIDVLSDDPFGSGKDENIGNSMKRISLEYQKLDRRTMEHKHDRFDHLPTGHFGNDRDPSKGSSTEKGVSQGYEKLDRRTMEPKHGTSDNLPIDHMGNDRDADEICLNRDNSMGKRMSREYQGLDRRTMEPKHDKFHVFHTDEMGDDRDASVACLATGISTEKSVLQEHQKFDKSTREPKHDRLRERMSRDYQKLDRRTMEPKHDRIDDLPTDQIGNDGNESWGCLARESSPENSVAGEYQKLNKSTMEPKHETDGTDPSESRHAMRCLTGLKKSPEYQNVGKTTMDPTYEKSNHDWANHSVDCKNANDASITGSHQAITDETTMWYQIPVVQSRHPFSVVRSQSTILSRFFIQFLLSIR